MPIRREVYVSAESICQCLGGNPNPCNPNLNPDGTVHPPFKPRTTFKIGTDFKLLYRFINSYDLVTLISLQDFDFSFRYFIKDHEVDKDGNKIEYIVSKDGTTFVNAIAIESASVIKAIFENYNLPAGDLWCDFTIIVPDPDMNDGKSTCTVTLDTAITLID